jgi:hypothetical protein
VPSTSAQLLQSWTYSQIINACRLTGAGAARCACPNRNGITFSGSAACLLNSESRLAYFGLRILSGA